MWLHSLNTYPQNSSEKNSQYGLNTAMQDTVDAADNYEIPLRCIVTHQFGHSNLFCSLLLKTCNAKCIIIQLSFYILCCLKLKHWRTSNENEWLVIVFVEWTKAHHRIFGKFSDGPLSIRLKDIVMTELICFRSVVYTSIARSRTERDRQLREACGQNLNRFQIIGTDIAKVVHTQAVIQWNATTGYTRLDKKIPVSKTTDLLRKAYMHNLRDS